MIKKTIRGFGIIKFNDDYGEECSLQESSAVEPHIWLGVHNPYHKIMYKDAKKLGLDLKKEHEECNECGWCEYPIPEEVSVYSRMHLNRKQAKELAKELIRFARKGRL